ncbi:MAG: hypothetical protein FJ398_03825 [Verrucomicrobia bacterium]|nr:hypothetical protein [Verrucomicrobiota bacterium]
MSPEHASVLIIVLWITFGLVSTALYFGHSMLFEFRASDNHTAGVEAEQAIEGAARYVAYALTNLTQPGQFPELQWYDVENVPVGESLYWLIGRTNVSMQLDRNETPRFGLIDEASKLNLNTATLEMLQNLPRMTPQLAAAIIDWRDEDTNPSQDGAETETYSRLNPPYQSKNARFESIEELRLLFGADPEILYGEDYNRNGILDPNENDGDLSWPVDNRDGKLDPGILEFVTIFSLEANTRTNGSPRVNVSGGGTNLAELLQEKFDQARVNAIQQRVASATNRSVLEFFLRSGMTAEEFAEIEGDLTTTNAAVIEGLINVNTAPVEVLACVPGIGWDKAQQVVDYRQSQSAVLTSLAWVAEILDQASAIQAGPYLTSRSYQFTADIAAVGHHGRGYRRTAFVFDTSEGAPKIIYRRDLGRLGWALGPLVRQELAQAKETGITTRMR